MAYRSELVAEQQPALQRTAEVSCARIAIEGEAQEQISYRENGGVPSAAGFDSAGFERAVKGRSGLGLSARPSVLIVIYP
jgi:hypothetical protein